MVASDPASPRARRAPGPAPFPFPIPGLGALGRVLQFVRDPLSYAGKLFERYGPLATLVRAKANVMTPHGTSVLVANGAALNREILTQHDRFGMYALSGVYFPDDSVIAAAEKAGGRRGQPTADRLRPVRRTLTGLFHVNGEEHRRHRRLLQPAFVKTRIDAYRDDMVAMTERMLASWHDGDERDVHEDLTELTLRVATKTLFGEDAGERGVGLARMVVEFGLMMFHPSLIVRLDVRPLPYRRWLDLARAIDDATLAIVREKQTRVAEALARGTPIGKDMLSMLVAARDEDGGALDEDELVGHTGVIFAAGHETSTNALAWTLFLLAEHPQVASDLVDELTSVLHGDAPTVEQLAKLPLLDAVVKESMRILPPVPMHPRIVREDTELAGVFVPERTELFLSIFHMHHDPAIFEGPRHFRPARWASIKPSVYEYNPFSAGPRMCIGAAFATMEIKMALALALQRFRLERLPGTRVDHRVAITISPRDGLRMRLRKADQGWAAARRALPAVRGGIRRLVELGS